MRTEAIRRRVHVDVPSSTLRVKTLMLTGDWINGAVRGTIPAIVVVCLLVFRKVLPTPRRFQHVNWDSDVLWERFRPVSWLFGIATLVVMIAFALVTWFALSSTNRMLAGFDSPRAIHLLPEPALWWFFPVLGGITCSCEITFQIFALFVGRETTDLFNAWMNNVSRGWIKSRYRGIDARCVLRWMTAGIALPSGIFVLLALPMHASVGPESIRDCGYLKACRVYALSDATRITQIQGFRDKSGKLIDQAGLVLDFKDGRRWSSAAWGEWQDHVDPRLTDWLLKKTGLPLQYALTEVDIPSS